MYPRLFQAAKEKDQTKFTSPSLPKAVARVVTGTGGRGQDVSEELVRPLVCPVRPAQRTGHGDPLAAPMGAMLLCSNTPGEARTPRPPALPSQPSAWRCLDCAKELEKNSKRTFCPKKQSMTSLSVPSPPYADVSAPDLRGQHPSGLKSAVVGSDSKGESAER